MDTHHFDALVIGAGIAGATAGAHLSPTHRVALLEAEESAGYHTTGRSAAIWILSYGSADARLLTGASRGFFEAPPPGFTEARLAHHRPVLTLADAAQASDLAASLDGGRVALPLEEARAMVPAIRSDWAVSAAIEQDAFDIDVAALHQGFLAQIKRAGGVLALRNKAGRLWHDKGLWHAETSTGDVFRARLGERLGRLGRCGGGDRGRGQDRPAAQAPHRAHRGPRPLPERRLAVGRRHEPLLVCAAGGTRQAHGEPGR